MVARKIEVRIADIDKRIADMQKKKEELLMKQKGVSLMGTNDERKAFLRALSVHGGFGFSYAQALALIKQAAEGSHMESRYLDALGDEGRVLLQNHLPKHRTKDKDADLPVSEPLPLQSSSVIDAVEMDEQPVNPLPVSSVQPSSNWDDVKEEDWDSVTDRREWAGQDVASGGFE